MATISQTPPSPVKPAAKRRRGDERSARARLLTTIAALTLLAAGSVIAGLAYWVHSRSSDREGIETTRVEPGRLMVTIEAQGNLESANNHELKCQVAGGSRIISIVPDGTHVEAGAELVQLDRSGFEQQLNAEQIVYERAVATKVQAEQDFLAAEADVREYLQGSYRKDLQAALEQITVARQNLETNKNSLSHTQRMFRKGFVTALQLEADKFAVERGQLDLDAALTTKKVLEEFTKPKTLKSLEAIRDAADARRRSEQASVNLEKAKLERIKKQLKHCLIRAPQRGLVVYGNDPDQQRGGGSDSPQIEEGAMIRERQTILRLPDLNDMQVKTSVHESRVPHISPGMRARIKILDRTWNGRVKSIANRPLPPQRYSAPAKNYAVFISLEGNTSTLKPGMSATVEILLADLANVFTVPVTAIVEQEGEFCTWVETAAGIQKRTVKLGKSDDRVIEVKQGLAAGDLVIVNPRATVPEAMQGGGVDRKTIEDDSRFRSRAGKSHSPDVPAATAPAGSPSSASSSSASPSNALPLSALGPGTPAAGART